MINWMQKNKRYLIPAIWVSTIAFVGAGFVGWGAYSFGNDSSSAVAKVGDTKVSIQDLNQKYSNLYNYFNATSNGMMTREMADEMGLENIALQEVINDTIMLNFAKELGIGVSSEDVAKYIVSMEEFQVAGIFDRNLYESTLKSLGIKASDFEKSLKRDITLNKLSYSLNLPNDELMIEALASAYFMQDRVSIKVLEPNFDDIEIDEDELKKFWESSKSNYKTAISYELDASYISSNDGVSDEELKKFWESKKNSYLNSDDSLKSFEEARDEVLKDYNLENLEESAIRHFIALKKDEEKPDKKLTISTDDTNFPLEKIVNEKVGEFIKPFEYEDGYLIPKISKINQPRDKTYEEAKDIVVQIYKSVKANEELEKLAKSSLENFDGIDIGYVSRDSAMSVAGLNESEFSLFLNELFNSTNSKKDFIKIGEKIVLFEITDQKLTNPEKLNEYKETLSQNAFSIKNSELDSEIMNALLRRYKIEQYYKGGNLE